MIQALAAALLLSACSSASKGPALVVCTAGKNGCPEDSPSHPKAGSTSDNSPSDQAPQGGPAAPPPPSQSGSSKPEGTAPDEPTPDPGGPSNGGGNSCMALQECCAAMHDLGTVEGSAAHCDTIVQQGDDAGCGSELASDAMPDPDGLYTPPPACMQ